LKRPVPREAKKFKKKAREEGFNNCKRMKCLGDPKTFKGVTPLRRRLRKNVPKEL